MARNDILPVHEAGAHQALVGYGRVKASQSFLRGEPIRLDSAGLLVESPDDPVDADVLGVAAADGDTTNADGLSSRASYKFGQFTDINSVVAGDPIPFYEAKGGKQFRTSNFSSAGSAFGDVAPAITNVGDEAGLSLISGSWGVDISASNNTVRIMDVVSTRNFSVIQNTNFTGAIVIFAFVAFQNNSLGAADAPSA